MRRIVSVVAMMAAMLAVMVTPAFGATSPKANAVGQVAAEFNFISKAGGGAIISGSAQDGLIGPFASDDKRRGPR